MDELSGRLSTTEISTVRGQRCAQFQVARGEWYQCWPVGTLVMKFQVARLEL